jgi:hypothetical protein
MTPEELEAEFKDADERGETMGAPHLTIARGLYRLAAEVAEFNGNFRMIHGLEKPNPSA